MELTIKDIAEKANVSITTVSRVLNKKKDGVGDATRKRVEDVIQKYNYRPNAVARSMITKNTKTIGLIVPDIRNPFFSDLARGIDDVANDREYSVVLCNVDNKPDKIMNYLLLLSEKNVDGIIFSSSDMELSREVHTLIKKKRLSVVVIDRNFETEMYSGVFIDNEEAGYKATKHLIDFSHTRIGCITGPGSISNSSARLKGYRRAHHEAGLQINKKMIKEGDYTMEGGYEVAKVLLESNKLTAVFAFNDLMAFGVYQAAEEIGLKIPEDLSVVGFDNITYNRILHPKLTTIGQPIYEIGKVAISQLLKQIEDRTTRSESIYLDTQLIIRDSTRQLS